MSKDHSWISLKEGVLIEMQEEKNKTKKSDWEDWKKTCAYLNCSSESQSRLGDFGVSRMLNWLGRVEGMTDILLSSENCKGEAWHWLDVHIIQKDSRGGTRIGGAKEAKASKDWLFDCEGLVTVEDIEKYFTKGFFRAAAQEYARSNRSSSISLDQPISNSQESVTLGELLGDGGTEIGHELDLAEYIKQITELVNKVFDSLDRISKIAILGTALGINLDDKILNQLTERGKSVLYERVKQARRDVIVEVKALPKAKGIEDTKFDQYSLNEDSIIWLIEKLLEESANDWGKNPENSVLELFDIA
jgi:hypothetical protein